MSRVYVWRGGCPAAAVPDGGVGSVEWLGSFDKAFVLTVLADPKPNEVTTIFNCQSPNLQAHTY
jgi:hypothetical protein